MGYTDVNQLPTHIFAELQHFFTVYKHLEGKTTEVDEMGGPLEAVAIIEKCIEQYKQKFKLSALDRGEC